MKRTSIFFCLLLILSLFNRCSTRNKDLYSDGAQEIHDQITQSVSVEPVEKLDSSSEIIDSSAIGNIHLNTTKDIFLNEKNEFIRNYKSIGALSIKSLNGYFYNNKLAAIEVISEKQNAHALYCKRQDIGDNGWFNLYKSKYFKRETTLNNDFALISWLSFSSYLFDNYFIKGNMIVLVSDYKNTSKPCDNFEEVINNPFTECYGHRLVSLDIPEHNILRRGLVKDLIDELPEPKKSNYLNRFNRDVKNNKYSDGFTQASANYALDMLYLEQIIPEIKLVREKRFSEHANDPSWSVIIIYDKGLLQQYKEKKAKEFHDIEQSLKDKIKKDLDII